MDQDKFFFQKDDEPFDEISQEGKHIKILCEYKL
jgi:hypothetical protein